MADPDIQKSKNFLKSLDEEMIFLSFLMAQINSLTSQVLIVSSSLKATFDAIDKNHKSWDKKEKGEKVS